MNARSRWTRSLLTTLGLVLIPLLLPSCKTWMALTPETKSVDLDQHSIVLMSVGTFNSLVPDFQTRLVGFEVTDPAGHEIDTYFTEDSTLSGDKSPRRYLVSIPLPAGRYALRDIEGVSEGIFMAGRFDTPADLEFEVKPKSICYVGHVDMTLRKSRDGESAAGGIFPLIDQAASGFSRGTFDLRVTGGTEEDVAEFRRNFTVLTGLSIDRAELRHVPRPKPPKDDSSGD